MKSWRATYALKNLTYEKTRQKIACPKFHSRKVTKVGMRKKRDKIDKTEGACHHLGEVCRSFQWSLPIISVKFVGHFSEVCRSFQLFLSALSVVLWSSKSMWFCILLLFNGLIKTHKKREKSRRDHFAGKKRQNKASKMSVYSTTTFLLMPSSHRTGNDYLPALAMFTLLRCLQLTKNISDKCQCSCPNDENRCYIRYIRRYSLFHQRWSVEV